MIYLSNKDGFLGIDNKVDFKEKVIIVPFGLEKTVSYGSGTKNGPKEIIKASHQVELFDEELNKEPYKNIGVKTLKPFLIKKEIKSALNQLTSINEKILSDISISLTFFPSMLITANFILLFHLFLINFLLRCFFFFCWLSFFFSFYYNPFLPFYFLFS